MVSPPMDQDFATTSTPPRPAAAQDYRGLGPPLGPEADAQRVDHFLARKFPFNSRPQWNRICRQGHLLCNGRPIRPAHRLRQGDLLQVFHPLDAEPEADLSLEFIAEESGVLAVFKPGNLPMHESGYYRRNTVNAVLAERFGPEWTPVHRLDRETSGILICAATPELRRKLCEDFATRAVAKTYLALVQGSPDWDELHVDQPIFLPEESERPRYVVDERGANAVTDFNVRGRAPEAALLEAKPRTGRSNQIRVHAAWAGHALIGDKVYHPNDAIYAAYHRLGDVAEVHAMSGFRRHALHASEISLQHPESGKTFSVSSPLPPDLADLWLALSQKASEITHS